MYTQYQQGHLAQLMGVRNAISLKYAFEINPVSIRTFKGCNVAWFTVFRKMDLRLKIIWCPPLLHDVLQS